uniref:Uncharacterized protein n=1 Tax=Arundo donax TaxID=35708 RepID=A0A0A9G346_ARUDO
MMTPPRSIWARPTLTEKVADFCCVEGSSRAAPLLLPPYTVTTPLPLPSDAMSIFLLVSPLSFLGEERNG